MTKFNHVSVELPELKTVTINRKRFYVTPKKNYYPSITTVLSTRNKKGLMEQRKRVGDEVANYISGKAAARGTKVHHMCEDYLNNMETEWPDEWEKHKNNFLPWCLFGELKNGGKVQVGVKDGKYQNVYTNYFGRTQKSGDHYFVKHLNGEYSGFNAEFPGDLQWGQFTPQLTVTQPDKEETPAETDDWV